MAVWLCRFVLMEEPDLTGIPVFTQAVYGTYPVSNRLARCTFVSGKAGGIPQRRPPASAGEETLGGVEPQRITATELALCCALQAAAIQRMGAQTTQHNRLLQQLSSSFPGNHSGSSVYVYDFGAAFSKVLSLQMVSCVVHMSGFPILP